VIVPVSPVYLVGIVFLVFAAFGFRRGWAREGLGAVSTGLAWLTTVGLGPALLEGLNELFLVSIFTLRGGFDSPQADRVLDSLRASPLVNPAKPEVFNAVLFLSVELLCFLVISRLVPEPSDLIGHLGGALLGGINGCMLTYVLLSYLPLGGRVTLSISIAGPEAQNLLAGNMGRLTVLTVLLTAGFFIYTLRRARRPGHRRGNRWLPTVDDRR